MTGIGAMLSNVIGGKIKKPTLNIRAYVDVPSKNMPSESSKYEKEEYERTVKEVKAIERALDNWIPEDVADRAKKSLEGDLEVKKAHALECKARLKQLKSEKSTIEDDDDYGEEEDESKED